MHGDDKIRFKHTDDLSRLRRIQSAAAAHRHQRHIDRTQRFDLGLRRSVFQIAQVRNRDTVIIKNIDRVAGSSLFTFLFTAAAIGGNTGDEYATDLKFTRAIDRVVNL